VPQGGGAAFDEVDGGDHVDGRRARADAMAAGARRAGCREAPAVHRAGPAAPESGARGACGYRARSRRATGRRGERDEHRLR